MKLRTFQILCSALFLGAILLSSCGGVTPAPELSQTETVIPAVQADEEKGIIGPENVSQLEIVDVWGQGEVYGVALSPDEQTIAVATTTGVYLYDRKTSQQKQFIGIPIIPKTSWFRSPSQAIAFSPDGNLLAIGRDNITIWNLSKNDFEGVIDNRIDDFNVVKVAFSPRGNTVVVVSMGGYGPCDAWGGNFALYDVESGFILYNEDFCPESTLYHFTFTNNGKVVFVGDPVERSDRGYRVSVVDSNTGVLLKQLSFKGQVDSISPDGSKIALDPFQDSMGTQIIDINTQNIVEKIDGRVIFLPDNQNLLVATEKGFLISASDHKVICRFESSPDLNFFEVYRDTFTLMRDNLVFWNDLNQSVEIWNTANCRLSEQLFIPIIGYDSLEYSANGNLLATDYLNNINLRDGQTGNYKLTIPVMFDVRLGSYYALSADGNTIVTVSDIDPYTITFWDSTSGKEVESIPTNFEYIRYVYLSPDGNTIATIDYDGIHLWDVKDNILLTTIPGRFEEIYFSPTSDNFALAEGNMIVFRNARTGEIEKSICVDKEHFDMLFSSDWAYLAIDGDEKIELLDMNGNKIREFMEYAPISSRTDLPLLKVITPGANPIYHDIEFSPNNDLLVAIRDDYENNSLRFWDTETGTILRDIPLPFWIWELEFSPDGKRLTISGNGVIYIMGIKETQ
jgi:WD40 repeat protein